MGTTITQRTEALGLVTRPGLKNRIKSAGSVKALAQELNVAPTTIRSWQWRLRNKAAASK